jgi:hypothetical protein
MNEFEAKAAAMLAGRIVCGLREMTAEQRRHVLTQVQAQYCNVCGFDTSVKCQCFAEPEREVANGRV